MYLGLRVGLSRYREESLQSKMEFKSDCEKDKSS